jgi:hypothetical protein
MQKLAPERLVGKPEIDQQEGKLRQPFACYRIQLS